MRKAIVATIIGMLALTSTAVLGASPASADVVDSGMEAAFVAKINALRAAKGLGQMAVHGELVGIARNWSQQMSNAGAISHNPNFPNQVSADWKKLGENVGRGGAVDVLFTAFVNSPHHYENLVDPAFNYVGVGVVVSPDGTIWTSHQFMQLGAAAAPAAPKPAPAPKVTAPKAPAQPRVTTPRAPAAPRSPSAPKPAATPAPEPAPAPKPAPVPPPRVVMSLELLQGLAAA